MKRLIIRTRINNLEDHYFHEDDIKNVAKSLAKDLFIEGITVDLNSRKSDVIMLPRHTPDYKVARVDHTFEFYGNFRLIGIQPGQTN